MVLSLGTPKTASKSRVLKLYIMSTARSGPILKLIFLSNPTIDDHCKMALKPISVARFFDMIRAGWENVQIVFLLSDFQYGTDTIL